MFRVFKKIISLFLVTHLSVNAQPFVEFFPKGVKQHESQSVAKIFNNIEMWITVVGSNVSIFDFDNDGLMDVYFSSAKIGSENTLLKNYGNGKLEKYKEIGIQNINQKEGSFRPIFFDADNDGDQDMFLTTTGCPRFFINENSKFIEDSDFTRKDKCIRSYSTNVFDFDKDGDLDIIHAAYSPYFDYMKPEHTKIMFDSFSNASNGSPIHIYRNNGKGKFSQDISGTLKIDQSGWVFTVGVFDFNLDGFPDLWLARDVGHDHFYDNNGKIPFKNKSIQFKETIERSGMNYDVGFIHNDKVPYALITQISIPEFQFNFVGGNQLWDLRNPNKANNMSKDLGTYNCNWAWGGKFFDKDNDGDLDLYVTNGYISRSKKYSEYFYKFFLISSAPKSILKDIKNWPSTKGHNASGFQKDCFFENENGKFKKIQKNIDPDLRDGRGVAIVDLDNNGRVSVIVSNQKKSPYFYKNNSKTKHKWIGFKLRGTKSNRDGLGAQVDIYLKNGKVLSRQNQFINGFSSQSDPRLHFGLGKITKSDIAKVTVFWPLTGTKVITNYKMNSYNELVE